MKEIKIKPSHREYYHYVPVKISYTYEKRKWKQRRRRICKVGGYAWLILKRSEKLTITFRRTIAYHSWSLPRY